MAAEAKPALDPIVNFIILKARNGNNDVRRRREFRNCGSRKQRSSSIYQRCGFLQFIKVSFGWMSNKTRENRIVSAGPKTESTCRSLKSAIVWHIKSKCWQSKLLGASEKKKK